MRSKGRNLRIKAPMCRALKKLCDPDGVFVCPLYVVKALSKGETRHDSGAQ